MVFFEIYLYLYSVSYFLHYVFYYKNMHFIFFLKYVRCMIGSALYANPK